MATRRRRGIRSGGRRSGATGRRGARRRRTRRMWSLRRGPR